MAIWHGTQSGQHVVVIPLVRVVVVVHARLVVPWDIACVAALPYVFVGPSAAGETRAFVVAIIAGARDIVVEIGAVVAAIVVSVSACLQTGVFIYVCRVHV
jgi:hypothetical protein